MHTAYSLRGKIGMRSFLHACRVVWANVKTWMQTEWNKYIYIYILLYFVYMYICIYVYKHINIHISRLIKTYTDIYIYMCVCIGRYVCNTSCITQQPLKSKQTLRYMRRSCVYIYIYKYIYICQTFLNSSLALKRTSNTSQV